jgi:hypothetical protein
MTARCNLVFTGQIAPGLDPNRVTDRLVRILHLSPEVATDLVRSGRPRMLKQNTRVDTAGKTETAAQAQAPTPSRSSIPRPRPTPRLTRGSRLAVVQG